MKWEIVTNRANMTVAIKWNTLARVITGTNPYDYVNKEVIHITPVLAKLHWLHVKSRVSFKLATLVYNIRQSGSPSYLASLLVDYKPVKKLRSSSNLLPEVTRPRFKTSRRTFRHSAIAVWNSIPMTVRECGIIGTFKTN